MFQETSAFQMGHASDGRCSAQKAPAIVELPRPQKGVKTAGPSGLEALLGPKGAAQAPVLEATPADTLRHLPVDALSPGKYQPRKTMDQAKLAELAESIKAQGVIQPIVVRDLGGKRFEIIAGERRWRASQLAGLSEIPVVILERV